MPGTQIFFLSIPQLEYIFHVQSTAREAVREKKATSILMWSPKTRKKEIQNQRINHEREIQK